MNLNEKDCLENADHFTAVRVCTGRRRVKKIFKTIRGAEDFALSFGDGRTMIYAVRIDGRSAHIRNA